MEKNPPMLPADFRSALRVKIWKLYLDSPTVVSDTVVRLIEAVRVLPVFLHMISMIRPTCFRI